MPITEVKSKMLESKKQTGVEDLEKAMKTAQVLVEALPYIKKLSGKTVVIKYGGHAMNNDVMKEKVISDIKTALTGDNQLSVAITNRGIQDIASATIDYSVNGVNMAPIAYSPATPLASKAKDTISLGTINLIKGINTFKYEKNNSIDSNYNKPDFM